jgi:hypothetical protein
LTSVRIVTLRCREEGDPEVKAILVAAFLSGLAACSSSASTPALPSVYGDWIFNNSAGNGGVGLLLKSNNTYARQLLELTSTSTGNDQMEIGSVVVTASSIAFTPTEWSCAAFMSKYPAYALTYILNNGGLDLVSPTAATAFHLNTSPPSTNFAASIGCFLQDGTFHVSPLAPVTN